MSALSWVYYVVGVSLLIGLGAVALEAMLRGAGRGGRWAWVVALVGLLAVPASTWLRPAEPASVAVLDVLAVPLLLLPPVTAAAEPRSWDLLSLLPYGWVLASALLGLALLLSYAALQRSARSWRRAQLEGVPLWISGRTGPAVVGFRRPRIVLPAWALELSPGDRRLMIMHEHEHLRGGDGRLLLFALAVCVLLPWNPVAWWVLHRLRGAMELDCDGRVLARAGDPAAYGRLLLEVGRRRTARHLLAAAFAEPRVLLERRVRALIRWPAGKRPLVAVAAGAAALLCFGFAYVTPQPLARGQQPAAPTVGDALVTVVPADTPPPIGRAPTSTPFTVAPALQNRDEITKALIAEYPPLLKSAGIGGKVLVWTFIDDAGVVQNALVKATSGQVPLDSAAVRVARQMRFTPAENRDRKVPVWVEIPVVFTTGGGDTVPPAAGGDVPPPRPGEQPSPPRPAVPRDQLDREPTFTPFTLAPELMNRDEITQLLVASYPPLLRSAGIGGKTLVWVFIDETGTVGRTQVKTTSGYDALDFAALHVAAQFRFRPAMNRDQKVPVWVEVPIVFTAAAGEKMLPSADDKARAEAAREFASYSVANRPEGTQFRGGMRSGSGEVGLTMKGREILNPEEVLVALARVYPPVLRDAGIGGEVQLRFFVNEKGLATSWAVSESSGRKELDEAALKLANVFRFTAGTAGWVTVPVQFSAN